MHTLSKYTLAFFNNANKGWLPVMTNVFDIDDADKEQYPQIFSKKNLDLLKDYIQELKQDIYLYFYAIFNILKESNKYNIIIKRISNKGYDIKYFYQGFPLKIENNIEFNLVIGIYYTGDELMGTRFNKPRMIYALYYNGSEESNDIIAYKIREHINKKREFININENLNYYFDEYICAYSYGLELNSRTEAKSVAEDIQLFLDNKLIKNVDKIKAIISFVKNNE
ncbi:MAG TPA: hypothetical protein H9804_10490 [Candidatus Mucispirillum faecigallinarum]|uniref:Uncharacterized protein n=1 Tax=Candidatus Mucispirillum faecigallinarum TaxID=2838699 RepID=A0A9D2GUM5_9BACT|nr:hypothetical protein [Candidatus Mucispirillum faecigallinarum]